MSRTFRRNKKHLIFIWCGTLEEVDDWDRKRFKGHSDKQIFYKRVHRFTRDHHSGKYGTPRYFRSIYFMRPERRMAYTELQRCIRKGEWDDHLTPKLDRGARRDWFW